MLKGFHKSPAGTADDGSGETLAPRSVPVEGMQANMGGQPISYADTLESAFSGLNYDTEPLNPAAERVRAEQAAAPAQPDHRPGTVHPLRTEVGMVQEGIDEHLSPEVRAFNDSCRAQLDWIGEAVQGQRTYHLAKDKNGGTQDYALAA
ncbi:MAG TPA: hypothetical protein VLF60_02390 [Candidatus Saccharimonadales bacterium]|nr:hypothetical protein [Candidatus Saccharimonadales bacterium]